MSGRMLVRMPLQPSKWNVKLIREIAKQITRYPGHDHSSLLTPESRTRTGTPLTPANLAGPTAKEVVPPTAVAMAGGILRRAWKWRIAKGGVLPADMPRNRRREKFTGAASSRIPPFPLPIVGGVRNSCSISDDQREREPVRATRGKRRRR